LKEIIWQARNQALHSEEGTFNKHVTQLFAKLEHEQGVQFSLAGHPNQSRAKQIISLLGWSSYADYLLDMQTLLPPSAPYPADRERACRLHGSCQAISMSLPRKYARELK